MQYRENQGRKKMSIIEFIKSLGGFELFYDAAVLIYGVVILINLMFIHKKMLEIKSRSDAAYSSTSSAARKNARGDLQKDITEVFDRQAHEPIRKDFNALNIKYIKYISLISVLPLLGLLGTVIGLIPGLVEVQSGEFDALYRSLSTALSSTLVGLAFAIVNKWYASVKPDQVVNSIETDFDEIDRLYEMQ